MRREERLGLGISFGLVVIISIFLIGDIIRFSDISASIAGVLVSGIAGILGWGFRHRIINKTQNKEKTSELKNHEKTELDDINKIRNTIKIDAEDFKHYEYDLRRDDLVIGKIKSEGLFNVYFLTKSSFKSFKNGSGFHSIDGVEDAHYFEPRFEVARRDLYYLVIENADDKRIIVDLDLDIKQIK